MASFIPCMDILPIEQKQLWPQLAPTVRNNLVLYGGTAIALQLGHRQSVDFDFFTHQSLDKERLFSQFPFMGTSSVIQDSADTLTVLVADDATENAMVKVSFFGGIGFGRFSEPNNTQDGILQVASLDDLMATKLKTLLQRVEAKDYIDIAAMVNSGVSLEGGLAIAKKMFGKSFQPSESLKAMAYFEGGDLHGLSRAVKETLIKAVKAVRTLPDVKLKSSELSV